MSYLKRLVYSLSILFILLASLLTFLFATTPGLFTTIKLANLFLPGKVHIKQGAGRLIDHLSFKELSYIDDSVNVQLTHVSLDWSLKTLIHRKLTLALAVDDLIVRVKDPSHLHLPNLKLPIDLQVTQLNINHIKIQHPNRTQHLNALEVQGSLNNQQLVIRSLKTDIEKLHLSLQANGQSSPPYAASVMLQFAPINTKAPGVKGKVELNGDFALYRLQGQFNGLARGTLYGTLKNGAELHTDLDWDTAQWSINKSNTLKSGQGHLAINGTLPDVIINASTRIEAPVAAKWQINAHIKSGHADANSLFSLGQGFINANVMYDEQTSPIYKGEIYSKNLDLSELEYPVKQVSFKSHFSGNSLQTISSKLELTAQYMDHLLRANISYDQSKIDANVSLGANSLRLTGRLPYQWLAKLAMPQPQLLHPALLGLQTSISANATVNSAQNAQLNLKINPGIYRLPEENKIPPVKFKGGDLSMRLTPEALQAKGLLTIDPSKTLNLSLRIPKFSLNKSGYTRQAIDGKISLRINSLDFLQGLSKTVENVRGQLQTNLTAKGSIAKPIIKGELSLSNAGFTLPKSGLSFSPIQVKLQSGNNRWQTQGSIMAEGHALTLKGQGNFSPQITGQINILGDNFPLMKSGGYNINVSPQLAINFTPKSSNITGTILVPSAQLKPVSFSNTVSLSEDVVFVSKEKTPTANPFNISTDIQIKMGKDVAIDVKGLKGFLDGAIRVKQSPHNPLTAIGELSIRDGKYKAYGQDLIINPGQLLFTGGPVDNPGLRIRAIRKFNNTSSSTSGVNQLLDFSAANIESIDVGSQTTVGIELSGRLNAHKITLFSIPPTMAQSDILSMLILGRPANQASRSGGQLLLAAISSMNLDSGTKGLQLLDQLKQNLGVDFNIQNNTHYNSATNQTTDNTAFVVTKSLSKRIYLSYNIGLLQNDSNVLTLKYLLNKFFSIQITNSDTGSGLDILYTRGRD